MNPETTEYDAPENVIDPFAGIFRLCRRMVYLVGLAFMVVLMQSIMMWHSSFRSTAHVYEVAPNGQASFIGDRQSRVMPREYEARYVAGEFFELFYGWNSASIDVDLAEASSLCSEALGNNLRKGFADIDLVQKTRAKRGGVRTEIEKETKVLEHGRRLSRVYVRGTVKRYLVEQYSGAPFETKTVDVEVIMQIVRRSETRPNGLEIVRIQNYVPTDADRRG